MLCVCVGDVMDIVFSVCIVRRGAVGARVWEVLVSRHADVVCLFLVCILWHLSMMRSAWLFSNLFAITERRDMGLYGVPLSMSLLAFGMRPMLANFHMCGIMLVLRAVFNMLVTNASPRGPLWLRCLMFYFYFVLWPQLVHQNHNMLYVFGHNSDILLAGKWSPIPF